MSQFTDQQKQKEAEREVGYRRRVYARMVADGRMKQEQMDRQIAVMAEIADDYRAKSELPL